MDKRTCSTEGCNGDAGKPGCGRGLCRKCYQRWWWQERKQRTDPGDGVKRAKGVRLQEAPAKACVQCGAVREKPPKLSYREWAERQFCGNACRIAWLNGLPRPSSQVELSCAQCGTSFTAYPHQMAGDYPARFCSPPCFRASRDLGITPVNKRIRMSAEYKRWRTAVFERDDYTCQFCCKRGGELQADHIKPFAFFPELRFDVDNGRTLCVPCHRTTETWGPRVRRLVFD